MCHFLRQTTPEMDSVFETSGTEKHPGKRELRTLVPLTLEVERNRDASTPLLKFLGHQYLLLHSEFECSPEFRRLVARRRYEKPDSSVPGMD